MKRIIFTACTFSTVLLAQAAQAVDYVQCREMLRTKNQFVRKAAKAEIYFKSSVQKDPDKECPLENFNEVGWRSVRDYDAWYACKERVEAEEEAAFKKVAKPLYHDYQGSPLYSSEGASWAKSYSKIAADMKTAGCPYQ